ncbi:hypothetical protein GCM10027203_81310 [Nonomuraea fastidiosa]
MLRRPAGRAWEARAVSKAHVTAEYRRTTAHGRRGSGSRPGRVPGKVYVAVRQTTGLRRHAGAAHPRRVGYSRGQAAQVAAQAVRGRRAQGSVRAWGLRQARGPETRPRLRPGADLGRGRAPGQGLERFEPGLRVRAGAWGLCQVPGLRVRFRAWGLCQVSGLRFGPGPRACARAETRAEGSGGGAVVVGRGEAGQYAGRGSGERSNAGPNPVNDRARTGEDR